MYLVFLPDHFIAGIPDAFSVYQPKSSLTPGPGKKSEKNKSEMEEALECVKLMFERFESL